MTETIGFIGEGVLALRIAGKLAQAGYTVRASGGAAGAAAQLPTSGAGMATAPDTAIAPNAIVATLVADAAQLEALVSGHAFLRQLGPGGIHLSLGVVCAQTARRLAAWHARQGALYVEAPLAVDAATADARRLWIPLAGAPSAKQRIRPVLDALGAQGVIDLGETAGTAALVRRVGSTLIPSAVRSLIEAVAIAQGNGLDAHALVAVLTASLRPTPLPAGGDALRAQPALPPGGLADAMACAAVPVTDAGGDSCHDPLGVCG